MDLEVEEEEEEEARGLALDFASSELFESLPPGPGLGALWPLLPVLLLEEPLDCCCCCCLACSELVKGWKIKQPETREYRTLIVCQKSNF